MDWSIALEKQAMMRRTLREIATSQQQQSFYFAENRSGILPKLMEAGEYQANGPSYFIERDIVETIGQQVKDMPNDWSLTHDLLLSG